MYESPIEVIIKDIQTKLEDDVFEAIQEAEINVSKEELIKALKYDRGQYNKGYADGVNELARRLKEHLCNYDLDDYHSFRAIEEDVIDDIVRNTLYWKGEREYEVHKH